jgi:transcriptional regulator with XRE-family HTH domain
MEDSFGQRLRRVREHAGITQAEAARQAGIRAEAWYAYESGRRTPSADRVPVLARAIGQPIHALYRSAGETALGEIVLGAPTRDRLLRLAPADREVEIDLVAQRAAVVIAAEIRSALRRNEMRDRPPTRKGRKGYRTIAEMERAIGEAKIRRAERLEQRAREASDAATGTSESP